MDQKFQARLEESAIELQSIYTHIQATKMKLLTLNFLTCAVKACKSSSDSFPLHPKDAELAQDEVELNPQLLTNILHRIDWNALKTTATEVNTDSRYEV